MKKIFQTIYPSLIWTGIIFWLLTMNASSSGRFSFLKSIPHYDKYIHWGIFVMFSMLWFVFWANRAKDETKKIALLVFVAGSVYGMGMEFYQLYFTNRSFSWWDGLADTVGAGIGVWLAKKSPYGNRGRNQN
ncbi:MAG: VanZ family protein [Chitinophagia bacterium]|jgi:VanZ family protein